MTEKPRHVLSIDQGTTSTRAIVFGHDGVPVGQGQLEHQQHFPQAGWVEHDPMEIWKNTREVIGLALGNPDLTRHDIAAVGITNQRETAIVWDRATGQARLQRHRLAGHPHAGHRRPRRRRRSRPVQGPHWPAARNLLLGQQDRLDPGPTSMAPGNAPSAASCCSAPRTPGCCGTSPGEHATDVTNASRTLLMDLATLDWDDELLGAFGVPRAMLPQIRSSSGDFGTIGSSSLLRESKVTGILGDQQAATFGQVAFDAGEAKNTYGTGNFLILNTGTEIVHSSHGLITTVAYRLGDEPPRYALEGSIAVTGSLIQWLRDNFGHPRRRRARPRSSRASVDDNGGVYVVPAFSGLFAPRWRPDARGAILGLTRFANKGHIVRAALEATAYPDP